MSRLGHSLAIVAAKNCRCKIIWVISIEVLNNINYMVLSLESSLHEEPKNHHIFASLRSTQSYGSSQNTNNARAYDVMITSPESV